MKIKSYEPKLKNCQWILVYAYVQRTVCMFTSEPEQYGGANIELTM